MVIYVWEAYAMMACVVANLNGQPLVIWCYHLDTIAGVLHENGVL